ncbi:MAG: hypothetical protein L6Q37_08100 [Bdellovibrionaceae bacterium]|nr:hypothetical protein [Pseudobdellovibrionaceae bacterium]NUM57337.1 hypothetical protein [Pseudobdellovibrionaceae bacterium]
MFKSWLKIYSYIFIFSICKLKAENLFLFESNIQSIVLKTKEKNIIIINPTYVIQKNGSNYSYFLNYDQQTIEIICDQLKAKAIFSAIKLTNEDTISLKKNRESEIVNTTKSIDLLICRS